MAVRLRFDETITVDPRLAVMQGGFKESHE
jgi:hypothetical protein